MTGDRDERKRILERRKRFLQLTAAGLMLSACDKHGATCHAARRNFPSIVVRAVGCEIPMVCLTVAVVDAGPPALDAAASEVRRDAGDDGGTDADQ